MDGFIFKKDICEVIDECNSISPFNLLKISFQLGIEAGKCGKSVTQNDPNLESF